MKKVYFRVALVLTLGFSMLATSCIGSFSLTNQLLAWNKNVGDKFVNEVVFFVFCVVPVYEVTALADILVLNSIEFWSGTNPVASGTKVIDGRDGKYLVKADKKGYTITSQNDGSVVRLEHQDVDDSWAVMTENGPVTFMTFVDSEHVKVLTPAGDYQLVELSEAGLMAFEASIQESLLANN